MTLSLVITILSAIIYFICTRRTDLADIAQLAKYAFAGLVAYLFGH